MFRSKTSDLHMHLNGSFSLSFLMATAEKNNVPDIFSQFKEIRDKYRSLLAQQSDQSSQDSFITLIWQQFFLIHQIIQTLSDIQAGTVDVINTSKAKYMEIRSTPKSMGSESWEKYVEAFVSGLRAGNEQNQNKKVARGLLSIDRTLHTESDAISIINRVVLEKACTGLLVGIDISGNPLKERTLTGEKLAAVLQYALSCNIGVAIHIGEVDTELERNDINVVLDILTREYHSREMPNANFFHGKVRLGHGIFLSDEQRQTIKSLQIPFEVCPSCHEQLNWWPKNSKHPVTLIYSMWQDPVVAGTDDEIIFGGNAKHESLRCLEILGFPSNEKLDTAREHQSNFRF